MLCKKSNKDSCCDSSDGAASAGDTNDHQVMAIVTVAVFVDNRW